MADSIDDILGMTPSPRVRATTLRGVIKQSDNQDEFLFAFAGCNDGWIALQKINVLHTRFFRHMLCRKAGEEPHYHSAVEIVLDPNGENASFISALSTLQDRMLRVSKQLLRSRRPMWGEGACGQDCNDIDLGIFPCGDGARPETDDEGHCSCDPDDCP
jgi:hypothetical protein